MASYTDIVPQFREYVPQLPVEAMVKVGMEKQRRYDEGVQKVQSYIDNVAGLDIYRPIDKQYTQSKLNELGNNLRTIAAGDFSNAQLVNSVGGMTKQIIRDPNIQAAVASTAHIRKQQLLMDDDRKNGKLHRNNEIFYGDQLSNYYLSQDLGKSFNTNYTSYTDYQKKWREIKKELDIKEDTSDLPFVMRDGKVVMGADGKPMVNDYMVRETFKGIDPNRLKQAIMSAMDDNDYRQMQIDAYVKYKGYSSEDLKSIAKDIFDNDQKPLLETVKRLDLLKTQNSGNQKMLDEINKQLEAYNKTIQKNISDYNSFAQDIDVDPEGSKYKLFSMNSLNQFANNFSNVSHIQQIVSNPIRQQMNEDRNYNLQVIKFQTENEQWAKTYKMTERKQEFDEQKEEFNRKLELYKLGLGPSPLGPLALKYPGAPPTDEDVLKGIVESFKQGADLKQLTKDQNALKAQWAKNQPKGTNLEEAFASALTNYRNNPNSVKDPGTRLILSEYDNLDKLQKLKSNAITDAKEAADDMNPEYKTAVSNLSNKRVNFTQWRPTRFPSGRVNPRGETYTVLSKSESEIYDDIRSGKATLRVDAAAGGSISLRYPKEGIDYTIPKSGVLRGVAGSETVRSILLSLSNKMNRMESVQKKRDADFFRMLNDKINSIVPQSASLPEGSASKFSTIIENKFAREQKGETEEATGFVKGKDFSIDNTRLLMLDKKTIPTYTEYGDDVYVTLSGEIKGKSVVQKFKLSKGDFGTVFPGLAETNVDIDFLRSSAANGSTNYRYGLKLSAENDPAGAFASANYSNSNTKKYIVKGDVFFDQNNKNNTTYVLYIKNPMTGNIISVPSKVFLPFKGSESTIQEVSDQTIDSYFKNNNLNANF